MYSGRPRSRPSSVTSHYEDSYAHPSSISVTSLDQYSSKQLRHRSPSPALSRSSSVNGSAVFDSNGVLSTPTRRRNKRRDSLGSSVMGPVAVQGGNFKVCLVIILLVFSDNRRLLWNLYGNAKLICFLFSTIIISVGFVLVWQFGIFMYSNYRNFVEI